MPEPRPLGPETPKPSFGRRLARVLLLLGLFGSILMQGLYAWVLYQQGQDGIRVSDFSHTWIASRFAAEGHPEKSYDLDALTKRTLQEIDPELKTHNQFAYPPNALLAFVPLAKLEHDPAQLLFLSSTYLLYLSGLLLWFPRSSVFYLGLAFWGIFANLSFGQNGFLTMGLLFWGFGVARTRPRLGGAILGLLFYKPQFALLPPWIAWVRGRTRVLQGILGVGLVWGLVSILWAGPETLGLYLEMGQKHSRWLYGSRAPLPFIPTVWSSLQLLGVPRVGARIVWGLGALGALAWLTRLLRKDPSPKAELAALCLASLLVAPKIGSYDLILLAPFLALWLGERNPLELPLGQGFLFLAFLALPVYGEWICFWTLDAKLPGVMLSPWMVAGAMLWGPFQTPDLVEEDRVEGDLVEQA